jgi:hypothetical protein
MARHWRNVEETNKIGKLCFDMYYNQMLSYDMIVERLSEIGYPIKPLGVKYTCFNYIANNHEEAKEIFSKYYETETGVPMTDFMYKVRLYQMVNIIRQKSVKKRNEYVQKLGLEEARVYYFKYLVNRHEEHLKRDERYMNKMKVKLGDKFDPNWHPIAKRKKLDGWQWTKKKVAK